MKISFEESKFQPLRHWDTDITQNFQKFMHQRLLPETFDCPLTFFTFCCHMSACITFNYLCWKHPYLTVFCFVVSFFHWKGKACLHETSRISTLVCIFYSWIGLASDWVRKSGWLRFSSTNNFLQWWSSIIVIDPIS